MTGRGAQLLSADHRRAVTAHVAKYAAAQPGRAMAHLLATAALFVGCLAAGPRLVDWTSAQSGSTVAAGVVGCAALGFLQVASYIKAFLLQHDASHRCLFLGEGANRAAAVLVGAMSCTSPTVWTREHEYHHTHSNDLDHNQEGQTAAWTLAQYRAAPRWQRAIYWLLTRRVLLLTVIPVVYFFVFMRVRARWYENAAQVALWATIWWAGALAWYVATFAVVASFGFLVFHAQHTFHGVYKRRGAAWDGLENSLLGSSHLVIPRIPLLDPLVRFALHGVAYHHVHHVHPGVPGFRLAEAHAAAPDLFAITPRIGLGEALRTMAYAVWDEEAGELRRL